MQAALLAALYFAIRGYVRSGPMKRIEQMVNEMEKRTELRGQGEIKKKIVISAIRIEFGHLARYAIAAAIEIILLRKSNA